MSQKFFKSVTAVAAVCCICLFAAGSFRLGKEACVRKNIADHRFAQIDKSFMNQLKINDSVSEEMKSILKDEVRTNPDIDFVSISENDSEIFSVRKTDPHGKPVYKESRNLLLTRYSKPYALDKGETYKISVRFRILSEAAVNQTFFCLLMSFLLLSIIIAACAVIPLRRKKSAAGPLFDTLDNHKFARNGHDGKPAPEPGREDVSAETEEDSVEQAESFFANDDEDEYEPEDETILDLDELTSDSDDESDFSDRDPVIDLNFKRNSFPAAAGDIIDLSVERSENCILLITEFGSTADDKKDSMIRSEWENVLSEQKALYKTDRKKTIAVLPRCTLTDGIKLIQDFRESRPDNGDYMWNAGLTALNGRKMRYEELLNEASRALIKSQLDNDNTVVCFNADAEKYNRYSKID